MTETSKIAIVTGAGTGLGRAASLALFADGWSVALAGRREAGLAETAQMAAAGERALITPTDVTDEAQARALFDKTVARFGRLDFLFNNAGTNVPAGDIDELTLEQWRTVVEVNLTGSFICAREAFRVMKAQTPKGGRIVNNGSISAYAPRPGSAPYTATKHAVSGLTRTLSLDGRPHDIAVGQLDIGNAESPMTTRMPEGVPQAHGAVAVEPVMDVAHVGNAIAHMASLPLDANVLSMTVMATKMPFVGRG